MEQQRREFTLEDNMVECANRLSRKMEEAFMFEMGSCAAFIKGQYGDIKGNESMEKLKIATEIMIEYLFGTAVAIIGEMISVNAEIEKKTVLLVMDKFERMRKIKGVNRDNQQA